MSWLNKQVSLYDTHADNGGALSTFDEIIFIRRARFGKDLQTIYELRKLDRTVSDYKEKKLLLKSELSCFTPAAALETKAKGRLKIIERTSIMQFDFDYNDILDYDIEELKRCVFSLPFIGYCGLSCSGDGFYALALIAEPERLEDYAEHCFNVFEKYGIKADRSKGKKVENLRYFSYDANMLVRENPEPLKIKNFYKKPSSNVVVNRSKLSYASKNNILLETGLQQLLSAQVGQRWATVQKVSYTLGGTLNDGFLDEIKHAINNNPSFNGEERKYIRCAEDCFGAGRGNPFTRN